MHYNYPLASTRHGQAGSSAPDASILFILIVEILNSAITETIVDKVSPEMHELAKRAKDMGSGCPYSAWINAAAIIWACILWLRKGGPKPASR